MAVSANFLSYNGIIMDLVKMHGWHREAVYNGNQYLYTRHILSVTVVLNPATNPVIKQLALQNNPFNQNISALAGVLVNQGAIVTPQSKLQAGPPIGGGAKDGAAGVLGAVLTGGFVGLGAAAAQIPQVANAAGGFAGTFTSPGPGTFPSNPLLSLPPTTLATTVNTPQPGMVTDTLIRHALMQPRQQLIYSLYGYSTLTSPWVGYTCDASGGPLPLRCDVVENKAAKTFIINFVIQTDVNECQKYTARPKILLSHTWTMSQSVDADCFCVRTIEGRAVLAKDRLEIPVVLSGPGNPQAVAKEIQTFPQGGNLIERLPTNNGVSVALYADDFRQQLFHPLPQNFKREKIEVKLQPDGCTLDYSIVDREKALNFNFSNDVTRLEGSHEVQTTWQGGAGYFEANVKEKLGALSALNQTLRATLNNPAIGWKIITEIGALGVAMIENEQVNRFMEKASSIPQIVHNITLRLWGNRTTTRTQLTTYAMQLVASRLNWTVGVNNLPNNVLIPQEVRDFAGNVDQLVAFQLGLSFKIDGKEVGIPFQGINPPQAQAKAFFAGYQASIKHDLAGKYVEVMFSTLGSPFSIFYGEGASNNLFTGSDDTGLFNNKVTAVNLGIQDKQYDFSVGFPTDDQSRGSYIEELVSQILLAPCQTPPPQTQITAATAVTNTLSTNKKQGSSLVAPPKKAPKGTLYDRANVPPSGLAVVSRDINLGVAQP